MAYHTVYIGSLDPLDTSALVAPVQVCGTEAFDDDVTYPLYHLASVVVSAAPRAHTSKVVRLQRRLGAM